MDVTNFTARISGHNRRSGAQAKTLRVPFGLKDGRMWTVRQVAAGQACGCRCPGCDKPLIAKALDSQHKQAHFAHLSESNCQSGFETAVHLKAKQLIVEQMELLLPSWDGSPLMPNPPQLKDDNGNWLYGRRVDFPVQRVQLKSAIAEQSRGDYIPDIVAQDESGELCIEIKVSHAVGDLKQRRVESEGTRMIEIDLSKLHFSQVIDEIEFERLVLWELRNRTWISCPAATDDWRKSLHDLKAARIEQNLEIADLKKQAIEQERLRKEAFEKEQLRLTKEENERLIRREHKREELRRPHLAALADLPTLVSFSRKNTLLREYQERDRAKLVSLLGSIESTLARDLVQDYNGDAWLYKVYPAVWQAAVYLHFIQGPPKGTHFNQQDVAKWVKLRFGVEQPLYELFKAQLIARADAKKYGHTKFKIHAWYFSETENSLIPNFYGPINKFMERLIYAGEIVKSGNRFGELST